MVLKLNSRDLYGIMNGDLPTPGANRAEGLSSNMRMWAYNALDSAVTLRVHEALAPKLAASPHASLSYNFVRAMTFPALDMMSRGIMVNQRVRQDETERYTKIRAEAAALLDTLADAVWGPETYTETIKTKEIFSPVGVRGNTLAPRARTVSTTVSKQRPRGLNPASPKQVLAFFNVALGCSPQFEIRKTPHGTERTPSANNKALRKWAQWKTKGPGVDVRNREVPPVNLAAPFVSLILTIRDADKMLGVLRSPLDADGRMRCSYNVVGTENGRWCVTGEHEVLTRNGWIRLDEWIGDDIVQWDVDGSLEFLPAVPQVFHNDKPLIKISTRRVSLITTPEHKQPYYTGKGQLIVGTIGQQQTLHSVPTGGKLKGQFLPPAQTQACVMMQADGCNVHERIIRFHFSRPRKIERCEKILTELRIPYKKSVGLDKTTYIYIYDGPTWLRNAKFFGPWCLSHDPKIFCNEIQHWDGTWTGTSTEYSTIVETNAKWLKTMGHLNNQFTSIFMKNRGAASWSDSYRCCLTVNTTTRFGRGDCSTVPATSTVFCPLTQTGFFLIRHDGQIIVTGNSSSENAFGRGGNLQNITPTMRRMFCADDGYRMISTDLEQAESRLVAGLVWQSTGDRAYWDACTSGDLHTTVARMTWPELDWTDDAKVNRNIANRTFPGLPRFSYRDVAKRLGHGSNYRGSAFGIAQAVGVPPPLVEDFQRRYFRAFPAHEEWHRWIGKNLQDNRYLDTPLGRRRWFFGRPNEDSTLREAIAFVPQSTVGELLNLVMLNVYLRGKLPPTHPNHLPIQLLLQNHDAFLLQTPESTDLPWLISELNTEFSIPIPFVRGGEVEYMTIPGEFVTGWNWAYKDNNPNQAKWNFTDGNPDGLSKWTGSDSRRRCQAARTSPADWLERPSF